MRVKPGARATVVNTTFNKNIVQTGTASKVAAGPAMGLKTWSGTYNLTRGSAAWFMDCTFSNSTAAVPGEVSVEDSESSVFTNTPLPTVWHRNNSAELRAQTVAPLTEGVGRDVFANVSKRLGPFLRPDDPAFLALVEEQAALTGMQKPEISQVPAGSDLVLVAPPPIVDGGDGGGGPVSPPDDAAREGMKAGQIAGIAGGAVMLVLLCAAAACFTVRRRKAGKTADKVAELVRSSHTSPAPLRLPPMQNRPLGY